MPGTVRLLVQIQQPAPQGDSPNMARREPGSRRDHFTVFSIMAAGKTAKFPVSDSGTKARDGILTDKARMTIKNRTKK